jgi:SAM-dependent methyltransferase
MNSTPNYSTVTELPMSRAWSDQCAMLYGRYRLASDHSLHKDVLEVACGSGIGLGLLARTARSVTGGDIDEQNCSIAEANYRHIPQVKVLRLDAHQLPFEDGTFDVVLLFEALYYLRDVPQFFREAHRILRPGGLLITSTVNCEWGGFNPSPLSTTYYTAAELSQMMAGTGFKTQLLASFRDDGSGRCDRIIRVIRWAAVHLRLIPKTMKGREWLKRLFYGRLRELPRQLPEGFAPLIPVEELADATDTREYRILYAIGRRD